ncbi:hypothetical protein GLOIN_2v1715049 [Rhizophagus clarus]|uniref:Uncharacterized protein n=1 Tax=Rhizophagus clarus TaxID=94130 RepID=A0A8H3M747_9GLOM|nr:hypothetical protein GLOIN_2v1715049 [Rhizophagus clarus]
MLRKLASGFRKSELKSLKKILNSCEHLESIKIWCSGQYLSEKEAIGAVVKHSHENFSELILHHLFRSQSRSFPEELESFFKTWSNRELQKPFSLVIVTNASCVKSLDKFNENVEIIKKYIKLGIIKKFKVANTSDEEYI